MSQLQEQIQKYDKNHMFNYLKLFHNPFLVIFEINLLLIKDSSGKLRDSDKSLSHLS